ncbi:MAG: Mn-Zn_transporter_SitC [uncultured Rubrobacteraceae bacterium]|uniref:Mn-Zn_transporter_SitC n=1 Tax=uncultured Rubrobacteraceae bacterium TaxID=349277 RepID=A0A6J4QQB6_9ACTN|nr:MAG: Mn-Zn_transporter_SitC [uncultured Rubrobacteraceae bacterium]
MIDLLRDLFFDYTIRNVALGAAILGVVGGTLGCFAILRRQGLFGDALAHATLPGVCVAFILSGAKTPIVLMSGAALTAGLGALLILTIVHRTRIKQDAALGIVLSVFFGAGAVLITYIGGSGSGNQSGLDRFIFGQAATIVRDDVITMGILASLALLVVVLLFKEFKLLSFDPAFAASLGFPVGRLNVLLTMLIVVAVIIGIQAVGVVLMAAMLIIPAASARQWTDRLGTMITISGLFGALSGVSGALISATGANLPTGPLIVLSATALLVVSLFLGRSQGFLWSWIGSRRNRRNVLSNTDPSIPYRGGVG